MKYTAQIQEESRGATAKDVELEQLRQAEGQLKVDLTQRKEDIER